MRVVCNLYMRDGIRPVRSALHWREASWQQSNPFFVAQNCVTAAPLTGLH